MRKINYLKVTWLLFGLLLIVSFQNFSFLAKTTPTPSSAVLSSNELVQGNHQPGVQSLQDDHTIQSSTSPKYEFDRQSHDLSLSFRKRHLFDFDPAQPSYESQLSQHQTEDSELHSPVYSRTAKAEALSNELNIDIKKAAGQVFNAKLHPYVADQERYIVGKINNGINSVLRFEELKTDWPEPDSGEPNRGPASDDSNMPMMPNFPNLPPGIPGLTAPAPDAGANSPHQSSIIQAPIKIVSGVLPKKIEFRPNRSVNIALRNETEVSCDLNGKSPIWRIQGPHLTPHSDVFLQHDTGQAADTIQLRVSW